LSLLVCGDEHGSELSGTRCWHDGFDDRRDRTAGGGLFPPERGTQYEVGVKADLTNRLSLTLAAYEITKTNVATTNPKQFGKINYSVGGAKNLAVQGKQM
jgi:outer membrane receptor for ferric coprogen and ferric-rhodotorulic acid